MVRVWVSFLFILFYHKFFQLSDILPEIREKLYKIIKKRDYDAISFEILRSSLKITCIFKGKLFFFV
jgi:hypothetical protein